MITALILATNEERDLPGALASLKGVAKEIVLVDGGSTDKTGEIAKEHGAKVFDRKFDNFTSQRIFGLSHANEPWILILDADERVPASLAAEIKKELNNGSSTAYEIPFEVEFMGKVLKFSGLRNEKHLRLFRKGAVAMQDGLSVHEEYRLRNGSCGKLSGKIKHRPYRNLAEYLTKCDLYTTLAAEDFVRKGKKLSWRHRWVPAYEFVRSYILRLGVLDGFPGLIWSVLGAYHRYIRISKIKIMQLKS